MIMDDLSQYPVVFKQSVAWGDMDAFAHVNNVVFYRYMESARIFYFDSLQILEEDLLTVVASNQCKYIKPVFYPDIIEVYTRTEEMRNSAFRMSYILFSTAQQNIVATGDAVIVCVDKINMQKKAIPTHIKEKLIELEKQAGHKLISS